MLHDRLKTVFWLWMIKNVHPCLAGRRSSWSDSSFSRIGRVPLTVDKLPFLRKVNQGIIHPESNHVLSLAHDEVRPVVVKLRRPREKKESSRSMGQTDELVMELTRPLISQEAWEASTGLEFEDERLVEALTQSGLALCTTSGDDNVQWYPHPNTEKSLEEYGDERMAMQHGDVLVYVGKPQKEGVVGSHLPLIKTQSILPIGAHDMANLLMDSTKVQIYNKMSLGRKDVRIFNKNTKIVRNLIQPPMAGSKMVTVTLMHSRRLTDHDKLPIHTPYKHGYIVVSRAVPGMIEDDLAELTRNEILMGVNLLQEIGPNECLMTAVTHVYSPALPSMFAQSTGVNSAVNFVRDIRQSCETRK